MAWIHDLNSTLIQWKLFISCSQSGVVGIHRVCEHIQSRAGLLYNQDRGLAAQERRITRRDLRLQIEPVQRTGWDLLRRLRLPVDSCA